MAQTTERWMRLESLFDRVVALPESQRSAFIDEQCGGDESLRAQLVTMLGSDVDDGVLDHTPPAFITAGGVGADTSLVGRRIAGYQVLRVIASGGMGTVYEAKQENPPRLVALKVLSAAVDSPQALRRFQFEAEALARLQHPAIASIHESGVFVTDDAPHGRPFFAMELVNGRALTQFADERGLTIHQRVALLIRVCEGIEHAHSRGVIHRDLKPANILVQESVGGPGEEPLPKILDFGIARAIDARQQLTRRTEAGQILGTLPYMSPEQVAGDAAHLDGRSDVYALGVIGYELLGGRAPHELTTLSMAHAVRVILEQEPTPLGELDRQCRGDLQTIIAAAMEKDPDRRYQSASQLAEDLRRFLAHEPITARRASRLYQLQKFARRNRVLVGGLAGVFAALALGVVATTWQWRSAVNQRNAAQRATQRAQRAESLSRHRLQQTYHSLTSMYGFADENLSELPGGTAARHDMADLALERLVRATDEAVAAGDISDTNLHALAYGYQRVGEALQSMGRISQTLENYDQTLVIRREQVRNQPDDVDSIRALGVGHWKLAEIYLLMGRIDDAIDQNSQALALHESMALRGDTSLSSFGYQGLSHRRIGDVLAAAGRLDDAAARYRKTLEIYEQVSSEHDLSPGSALDRREIAVLRTRSGVSRSLASVMLDKGDAAAAIELLTEALAIVEQLDLAAGPADAWETAAAARCHALMAQAMEMSGRRDEARHSMALALELADRLAQADAINADSQYLAAWCSMQAGELEAGAGQPAKASEHFTSAAGALLALLEIDGRNAMVRAHAGACCARVAELLRASPESAGISAPPLGDAAAWTSRADELLAEPEARLLIPTRYRAALVDPPG
jgi:tetratricopeptide (TPR) repeat protein